MGILAKPGFKVTPMLASCSVNFLLALVVVYYTSLEIPPLGLQHEFSAKESSLSMSATQHHSHYPIDLENATTIFNSVYGALKQKDANMNPVGVTFIPAYIPPNTMMYHSTSSTRMPDSFEWIAMDYEFSYSFAHFPRGKGGPGGPGGPKGPHKGPGGRPSRKNPSSKRENLPDANKPPGDHPPPEKGTQFLYTFKNTKPLDRIIFLDGASAAKSETGEMDQQLILSDQKDANERVDEREAAAKICKWGKSFGLQGYVRLEVGYEIVLCDFYTDIELVSNVTLSNVTNFIDFPAELAEPENALANKRSHLLDVYSAVSRFEWARAGSQVNDGESRILLDYSKMVTPVNRTWINADPYQRRINNISSSLKESIRNDLQTGLVAGALPFRTTNWPQIIGNIMSKFTPILHDLNNTLALFEHSMDAHLPDSLEYAAGNITRATYNLVRRYTDESIEDEKLRVSAAYEAAVHDYVHPTFSVETKSDSLIFSATYMVTKEVIEHVFDLFFIAKGILPAFVVKPNNDSLTKQKAVLLDKKTALNSLLNMLQWSSFVRCNKACNWDEICYVPTWGPGPVGWGSGGNQRFLHYENGSYRVNSELQCIKLDVKS